MKSISPSSPAWISSRIRLTGGCRGRCGRASTRGRGRRPHGSDPRPDLTRKPAVSRRTRACRLERAHRQVVVCGHRSDHCNRIDALVRQQLVDVLCLADGRKRRPRASSTSGRTSQIQAASAAADSWMTRTRLGPQYPSPTTPRGPERPRVRRRSLRRCPAPGVLDPLSAASSDGRPPLAKDLRRGLEKQGQIEADRPVPHVRHIHFERSGRPAAVPSPAKDGDAGLESRKRSKWCRSDLGLVREERAAHEGTCPAGR